MNRRVLIAAVWGILIGSLIFAAGPIAWLSVHTVIAAIQTVLMYLMLPGLIVADGVGSLGPGAVVNALITLDYSSKPALSSNSSLFPA